MKNLHVTNAIAQWFSMLEVLPSHPRPTVRMMGGSGAGEKGGGETPEPIQ